MQNITRFASINPVNNSLVKSFDFISSRVLDQKIAKSYEGFKLQKARSYDERAAMMMNMGNMLEQRVNEVAKIVTTEMGKPLAAARGEILKTAAHFKYYAENGERMLRFKPIHCAAKDAYIAYQPTGPLLCKRAPI